MFAIALSTPRGDLLQQAATALRRWPLQLLRRHRFNRMLDLDDRILDDIGVVRWEVEYASRLPLSMNAAIELRLLAERRRRQRG